MKDFVMKNSLARPKLPSLIKQQLAAIEPSIEGAIKRFPCDVQLKTGEQIECVYFISLKDFVERFRFYPDRGRDKGFIDLEEISSISDSRFRLPAKFANILNAHGESGMGYLLFTVVFRSGLRQVYLSGDAGGDFLKYPQGLSKEDVVDVWPDAGRGVEYATGPKHSWCVFSD
jgi:hypothetical protein